jgi:hypothetical protein
MDHPTDFFTMVPTDVALMTLSSFEPEFSTWISGWRIVRLSCPGHKEFTSRVGPSEINGFRTLVFARLTGLMEVPPASTTWYWKLLSSLAPPFTPA